MAVVSSSNVKDVLSRLHALWDSKKYEEIDVQLLEFFKHSNCLFDDCLDLVEFSKEKRKLESLGGRIMNNFSQHVTSKNISSSGITEEMKERVLDIASISHSKLAAKLITTFEVDKPSLELVCHHIKTLSDSRGNLNAAISLVTLLQLQDKFSIYDIAVPIFMQNKLGLLEDYMQGSEKVQVEMIGLLNNWLSEDFNLITFCSEHGIRSMREEVLRPQFHEKMLTKWLKTYGKESQAEELCPNLCRRRSLGAVKYLLYRYYVEDSATFENAVELIQRTVGQNEWLQNKLIDIVEHTYNDYEAVDAFEKLFNMKRFHLQTTQDFEEEDDWGSSTQCDNKSNQVKTVIQQNKASARTSRAKVTREMYHTLKLSDDCIMMVNSAETLANCVDAVLEQSEIVGIDAEWLFTRNFSEVHDIALLQLAIHSCVFLLDMIVLSDDAVLLETVAEFLNDLFLSQQHVKVGYGLREDLKKISSILPGIDNLGKQSFRVIDLSIINKHVQRLYPQVLSSIKIERYNTSAKQVTGLSKMVQQTLGAKLDKSEQISDWERRPLRYAQIKYAALDAYCLIEIYDVLTSRLSKIDPSAVLETIMIQKPKTTRAYTGSSCAIGRGRGRRLAVEFKKQPPPSSQNDRPIMVSDFRVVCDNMFQGLGRQLRCCGIDTCILTNLDCHEKAAELARIDKRVILTTGSPFVALSSQVPIGDCLDLPNDLKAKEQLAMVLEHYNVKVRLCDIFSRCQLCNCGKYLRVLPADMLKLFATKVDVTLAGQVPWHQFRNDTSPNDKKYAVVVDSDEDICDDDELLIVDGSDPKSKPSIDIASSSTTGTTITKKIDKKNQNTAPATSSSIRRSDYNINPDSLSKSSTLNFQTGEIVTVNPVGGEKLCTPLLYKQVPKPVCNQVTEFFCCIQCGKVYWEGQHFGNVISKFGDIISK